MTDATLGKLERADLRDVWANEATDFTPWLARPDNLAILGDTIGIELECEAQERNVGLFRADILCKNLEDESWVLIENQLDRTDHIHLGQLLTYAAGLQTVTIVWVAQRFTDEHRAALDWLNEITGERARFFGLEIELWRIGPSLPAPRFNVVCKPNSWTKTVGRSAQQLDDDAVSELRVQQQKYWTALNEYLAEHIPEIRTQRPKPRHWATFAVGRAGFVLHARMNTVESRIGAELFIRGEDAKAYFDILEEQKAAIEHEVGQPLSWQRLPEKIGSRVAIYMDDVDPLNEADWPRQHQWLAASIAKLDRAFRPRVRMLDIEDAPEEDVDEAEAA